MHDLAVRREKHVAVVEIRRPPANFFDAELLGAIATAAEELQNDGTTRAIVLCSQGKHFCAGANFGSDALTPAKRGDSAADIYRQGIRLFEAELPIVAAVQGAAVGGGLGLACAADFRVASASSRFHANFSSLGFHHGFALSVTLPRIIGEQRALDILANSRRIDGVEAASIGLVDRLVDDGEVLSGAIALAEHLCALAPLAVRAIKSTLKSDQWERVRAALEHELAEQRRLWATKDSEIGIEAGINRQVPVFIGR